MQKIFKRLVILGLVLAFATPVLATNGKEDDMKGKMYATVRRYEGVKDPAAAAKQVAEKFVPLISALPGFVEYYWIDLGAGAMMSVTIFKTLADAERANEKAKVWVKEHLSSVLSPATRIEAGTIVAHKAVK